MNDLTLAIVTRRRPKELSKCIESIINQSCQPSRIIIIDNDKLKTAKKVVNSYQDKIEIIYSVESKVGISRARNKALRLSKSKYLGFIDDDCVLNPGWVEIGLKMIKKLNSAYIVGETSLLNPTSAVAQARFYHSQNWFKSKIDPKTNKIDPQGLDTKNIIFDLDVLRKHNLEFDKRYSLVSIGGGEDIDMGLQLNLVGLSGVYVKQMKLRHKEQSSLRGLIKKGYWSGRASYLLVDKWKLKNMVDKYRADLKIWLEDFWLKPYTNQLLSKKTRLKAKLVHILTKCYDRAWIKGYLKQKKLNLI